MKLMVLDGNSIVNRAYYGVRTMLKTRDGLYTNAIFGFLNILTKLLEEEQPEAVCVTFDLHAPTFRHKAFDGYKAGRHPMPEELKMQIGCVFPRPEEQTVEIKGRCLMTGLPRVFSVSSSEMIEAFEEPSTRILEAIHGVLERTPPELTGDISSNGIVMTGGGSLVDGFDKLITARTGIHTVVAEDAISCVAEGTGKSLDSLGDMQDGTVNLSRRRQMN